MLLLLLVLSGLSEAVDQLQSDDIEIRDRAMQELIAIGEPARGEMMRLAKGDDVEIRGRALEVLQAWGPTLKLEIGAIQQKCSGTTAEVTLVNTGTEPVKILWRNDYVITKTLAPGERVAVRGARFAEKDGILIVTWNPAPELLAPQKPESVKLDMEKKIRSTRGADVFIGTLTAVKKLEK